MPGTSQTTTDSTFSRSERYYYEVVVFEVRLHRGPSYPPISLRRKRIDQVEGTLYRAFKESFTQWSQSVFRDMFSLPQGSSEGERPREGDTDANPIRLVGCTKAEFESLLELMNPRYVRLDDPVYEDTLRGFG